MFLSLDPDPGDEDDIITQNGYTYANNNPVMLVDPDGHWALAVIGGAIGGVTSCKAARAKGARGWKLFGAKAGGEALGAVVVHLELEKYSQGSQKREKQQVIRGHTKHGLHQSIDRDGGRGVSIKAKLDAVRNSKKTIKQSGGKTRYYGKKANVVVNKRGQIVTVFGKSRAKGPKQVFHKYGKREWYQK
ncbi:LOW QUALITY PROTEIN: wall-associated protein precursor [Bacillus sp. JCM 19047]|nr:LOW QUALITY PROTEIN: wall-associated protein precursor [Bacillus sp. JCM 19047]